VKSLENTCHTWALLHWWFTTKRRYIKCMHLYPLPFYLTYYHHRLYSVYFFRFLSVDLKCGRWPKLLAKSWCFWYLVPAGGGGRCFASILHIRCPTRLYVTRQTVLLSLNWLRNVVSTCSVTLPDWMLNGTIAVLYVLILRCPGEGQEDVRGMHTWTPHTAESNLQPTIVSLDAAWRRAQDHPTWRTPTETATLHHGTWWWLRMV